MGGSQRFTDTMYEGTRNGAVSGASSHVSAGRRITLSLRRKF